MFKSVFIFKMCLGVFGNGDVVGADHYIQNHEEHGSIYICCHRIVTIQNAPLIRAPDSPDDWNTPYIMLAVSIKLSARLGIRVRHDLMGWAGRHLAAKLLQTAQGHFTRQLEPCGRAV